MTDVLSVIPARGGSKEVPQKNLRLLDSKPLIAHQVEASLGADGVSKTIVSTDSQDIAEAAKSYGAGIPFERPVELAEDDVPVIDAVKHAAEYWDEFHVRPEYVLCLQPTSPFTTSDQIDSAIRMARRTDCDSVVAISPLTETHPYRTYQLDGTRVRPIDGLTVEEPDQRQDRPDVYGFTGAIYLRKFALLTEWDRSDFALGSDIRGIVQEGPSALEIDTPFQLQIARAVAAYDGAPTDDIWSPADDVV